MKNKLAALILEAASAMVFTGCGSSDNQSKGSVDKNDYKIVSINKKYTLKNRK